MGVVKVEPRLVLAHFLLPPVLGLFMFLLCLAMMATGTWILNGSASFEAARAVGMGVGLVAVVMTGFGAVPGVAWLMRRGPVSFRSLATGGILLGNAPSVLFYVLIAMQPPRVDMRPDPAHMWTGASGVFRTIVLSSAIGFAAALWLWAIALRHHRSEVLAKGSE